jgi:hypothetical protein
VTEQPGSMEGGELPGELRLQALYRKLFGPAIFGPAAVVVVTIAGGLFGLKVSVPTWPLAALAIGGIAAALWRILVGDRSHAGDLVRWRAAQRDGTDPTAKANKPGAQDAAAMAAEHFEAAFARDGEADSTEWRAAIGRLRPEKARYHKASVEIYDAAVDLAEGRPWLIRLDKAAIELGPFEIPQLERVERRIYPLTPVLAGIATLGVVVLVFGPRIIP